MKPVNVLLGPPPVVIITLAAPALVLTGVLQVIVVLSTITIVVAAFPLNITEVAPVKFVPVIVTILPPAMLPDDDKILVITGGVI